MTESQSFQAQAPNAPGLAARFPQMHPPLSAMAAAVEANRCLFCFDAPCTVACPTHIDVPRFIKKISTGNLEGSARTILDANILGASCARACPVEVLCQGACVLNHAQEEPIAIGRLQRFSMDAFHSSGASLPFTPGPDTGKHVALIGAGPASLACAAELRRHGIRTTVYDARPLPGGLNTYGIAEYKLPLEESLREIDLLSQLGVDFRFNITVDAQALHHLEATHDAIFLGIGMGGIHKLGLPGEALPGVTDALELIAAYKSGALTSMPGAAAIIGAGNTAIDAAIAAVRLGAHPVYMIYRRGREQMSAFTFEYDHASAEGVQFLWHMQPVGITGTDRIEALELVPSNSLAGTAEPLSLPVDNVVLAIGQQPHSAFTAGKLQLQDGRILVNRTTGQTTHPQYFAGGDCTNGGREVVDAVADGKRAGIAIAAQLKQGATHAHA